MTITSQGFKYDLVRDPGKKFKLKKNTQTWNIFLGIVLSLVKSNKIKINLFIRNK